jgi:uncharacterized protein
MTTFIIPGVYGSESEHWQSWMERRQYDAKRIHQQDWNTPCLEKWSKKLLSELERAKEPVWLVAHSLGCLVSVVAGVACPDKVAGAFLVAPADPRRFTMKDFADQDPEGILAAKILPKHRLPFPTMMVASENDPWMLLSRASYWAHIWGAQFVNIGQAGHINVKSGYGDWPEGLRLFAEFRAFHELLPTWETGVIVSADPMINFKQFSAGVIKGWDQRQNQFFHS